jgi:hypothetical protein
MNDATIAGVDLWWLKLRRLRPHPPTPGIRHGTAVDCKQVAEIEHLPDGSRLVHADSMHVVVPRGFRLQPSPAGQAHVFSYTMPAGQYLPRCIFCPDRPEDQAETIPSGLHLVPIPVKSSRRRRSFFCFLASDLTGVLMFPVSIDCRLACT